MEDFYTKNSRIIPINLQIWKFCQKVKKVLECLHPHGGSHHASVVLNCTVASWRRWTHRRKQLEEQSRVDAAHWAPAEQQRSSATSRLVWITSWKGWSVVGAYEASSRWKFYKRMKLLSPYQSSCGLLSWAFVSPSSSDTPVLWCGLMLTLWIQGIWVSHHSPSAPEGSTQG